jgi:DNA sulfur modification protein DndB
MLKPSRLKNIADYIDNGGQFPTNIVVNIKSKNKRKMKFEKTDDVGGVAVGLLTLPQQYCCAWVIDGQHRLYGYAYSDRSEKSNDKTAFPVLAYENMPPKEEAKMFVDINHEQVKVQKSLLIEIYSTLNWGSDDPVELIEAISSRVGLIIDRTPSSPFYNRIITSGNQKSGLRCLTTTSFSDGLRENKFFGEQTKSGGFIEGPFWASYASEDALDRTLEKAQEILNGYFGFFATNAGEHWNLGDGQGGFLAMNLGVRTLLRVLKSLLAFTERETGLNCRDLRADEILDYIEQYTAPISNFFKDSTAEKVAPFRRNSSLAGVKDNSLGMMFFIKEEFADFYADGLKEYIDSRDEEGTEESRKLVADIQKMMSTFVIGKLKEHYGEKDRHWWYEGIPNSIRERCVKDRENAHGKGEPENYFYLLDYSAIAANNWASIFQHSFSYYNQGKKIDRLKWVKELNDIRNIVSHPERGVLNTEQVQFVRNLHQYTKEKFKLQS